MRKHYLLYAHGGCYNHGAEASIKCGIEFLRTYSPGCKISLSSHFPEQDFQFKVDADEIIGRNMNGTTNEEIYADTIARITPKTICLSVGGDNYCYPNWQRYATIHKAALQKGTTSILWSCSFEPTMIDKAMLDVLRSHHLITVRESLSAKILQQYGLHNFIQVSDIAFNLTPKSIDIPKQPYIVINLSPLVIRKNKIVLESCQALINHIIDKTEYYVALLPHVEVSVDNDFDALNQLYGSDSRIIRIPTSLSAAEYKHIIANASFCIAARTHVTIAAWSECVPTIALGYSTKALGIATDLGQNDLVLDISTITVSQLLQMFNKMLLNSQKYQEILQQRSFLARKNTIPADILKFL